MFFFIFSLLSENGYIINIFCFCSFLSQTIHLLDEDDSLYCISAWNDQVSADYHLYSLFSHLSDFTIWLL